MADQIVSLGEQIKPQVDVQGAVQLAERLYGLKVDSARELNGYDDKNYYLQVSQQPNNKYLTQLWPEGYVLKIMNSSDSKKLDYVEAQCGIMIHLGQHGVVTPQPQKNVDGKLYCLEKLQKGDENHEEESKEHVVRLLTFQEGVLLKDIPKSSALYYEVGRYAGKLDLILKDFFHPAYKQYSSLWLLKNVPKLRDYIFVIRHDKMKTKTVTNVVQQFEDNVLSRSSTLQSGMIHGDINEQNLLCKRNGEGNWYVSAVLDFGDSHHSAYVLELAINMAYMMLLSEDLETGAHVIAGYCSLLPLPLDELKLLKVCVSARLCQSLVLGLYTHSQDPDNKYVLSTQNSG